MRIGRRSASGASVAVDLHARTEALARVRAESRRRSAAPASDGRPPEPEPDFAPPKHLWPSLSPAALHGLAGAFVALVGPTSEADPVALLVQFLTAFGNAANRGAYFQVEGTRHHLNLFAVIVGPTAKARKGTSWGRVRHFFELVDDGWARTRITQGLCSGEGLIWAVRDPIMKTVRVREKGSPARYEQQLEDPGIADKRLLVLEEEMASAFRVMKRDGSTLSPVIREAWDGGRLSSMTKNSPAKATDAHISAIGHITEAELRKELSQADAANGFANRFLFVLAKRANVLPEGGTVDPHALQELARRVIGALDVARKAGEVRRDDAARTRWAEVYPSLSEGRPGLLGSIVTRAEAQVMRLAMAYAVLNSSPIVRLPHLEAALALWGYCEASARYVFADALGSPDAERLLAVLRERGRLDFTELMRDVCGGHWTRDRINAAVAQLEGAGLAEVTAAPTAGRPRRALTLSSLSTRLQERCSHTDSCSHSDREISVISEVRCIEEKRCKSVSTERGESEVSEPRAGRETVEQ